MKKQILTACFISIKMVFASDTAGSLHFSSSAFYFVLATALSFFAGAVYYYLKYRKIKLSCHQKDDDFFDNKPEFHHASFELQRKEQELKLIIDHAPIGIATVTTEGKLLDINQAYADILGYTREELLEGCFYEVGYKEDIEKSEAEYQKLLAGEEFVHIDKRLIKKDGSIVYVSQRLVLIRNLDKIPLFALSMTVDISQRQYVMKKLSESENFYKTVLSNMSGIVYNCINDKDWTMSYISDGVYDMSGYPASDFINNSVRSYNSIIHPEDKAKVSEMVKVGLDHHDNYYQEYRIINKAGDIRWVYEIGRGIFDDTGNLLHLSGTIMDITARKKNELELAEYREHLEELVKQRTLEIEEKNKKVEEFNKLFIGREFRIKDLRDEVTALKKKLNELT